jgi:hypothetical protein
MNGSAILREIRKGYMITIKNCLGICALLSVNYSLPRIYKLNTQYSYFFELKTAYLCNYDDERKSVMCYQTSLTDPAKVDTLLVAKAGEAYETCGLGSGKGFVGTFYREDNTHTNAQDPKAKICSVWIKKSPR